MTRQKRKLSSKKNNLKIKKTSKSAKSLKRSSKLAEEKIFELLVEAVQDYAIFVLDTEGRIMTWNFGAQRLKGYTAKEAIGMSFKKFYPEAELKRGHPDYELAVAAEKGKYEEEGWRIKKDGSLFWANVVITAIRDKKGKLIGFGKVTRDLTQRKETEDALRKSEEKFRLLIEDIRDYAIFMLDPQGNIVTWNKGAERCKGYRAYEIIGKHFSIFYEDEDKKNKKPETELQIATSVGRFEDEGWRIRKDGSRFWANVVITAIYDQDKQIIGFSKVTRDLSERKKTEDELKQAYGELELRVQERTKELLDQKVRAEQAVKARDVFFSVASHELKTPLSSLKLQTQMRKRSVQKGDLSDFSSENLIEMFDDDNRQIERLGFLIDNMLDVSRMTSGSLQLYLEQLNLNSVINDVVKRMTPMLDQSGNTCHVSSIGEINGYWDRHRLEQVFVNLLSNCGKYAPGTAINILLSSTEQSAMVAIKDHGPGMPEEVQKKIFSPFERGVNRNDVSGLGLGLFIVKQIIDAHSGRIEAKSEMGKGAQFTIELPIKQRSSL